MISKNHGSCHETYIISAILMFSYDPDRNKDKTTIINSTVGECGQGGQNGVLEHSTGRPCHVFVTSGDPVPRAFPEPGGEPVPESSKAGAHNLILLLPFPFMEQQNIP
jgi:hypothetical protein